ncbi:DUF1294 domain-containing protein [Paenibacillus sp. KACC 21273]|uniref:DUF1294 domain-containing protein n=1 Tax=Paenibacillus sp. KACC 21273 TaxID=3025665 RepID=UPI002365F10C|nr:DUF1294 domain-containing protein [Paenibacillus sp. KACC 21273]WDF50327.1 DUF1294 domain-containing protein [Paenibacillus sp. KACC 21273]
MEQILGVWLLIVNIVAYIVMAIDKKRAQRHRSRERIPEKTLFIWAAIGGALGIWIAMMTKRHKTKHRSFVIGVPLLLVLNIVVYGYVWMTWIR